MTPVTSSGSSHGTRISDLANRRSGNRRLNSSARPKPTTNCKSSDSAAKLNVRAIALSAVGSFSVAV